MDHTYPEDKFEGRGIVICAGGNKYFTNAWVNVHLLRHHGCTLPIEFWYLGDEEMTPEMKKLVEPLGVTCINAREVQKEYPVRTLNGWELKPYAIIHSRFKEVMLLDADNTSTNNPEYLFDTPEMKEHGAIFWPDYGRLPSFRSIWFICNVKYQDEPEFETGQIVVDKSKCWKALQLTMHINEHSDFYYIHVHGDKETFHMAWRKLNQTYAMPRRGIHSLAGTMCQHDFNDERIFQHRNMLKWNLGNNAKVEDFLFEDKCLEFLLDLRDKWRTTSLSLLNEKTLEVYNDIVDQAYFQYIREGSDVRLLEFQDNFMFGEGNARMEQRWGIIERNGTVVLQIRGEEGLTAELTQIEGTPSFKGNWVKHEKMVVKISPPL